MNGTDIYLNFNKIASQHILNVPPKEKQALMSFLFSTVNSY